MFFPVYMAMEDGGCIAVFINRSDCERWCSENKCFLKIVDIKDIHIYL